MLTLQSDCAPDLWTCTHLQWPRGPWALSGGGCLEVFPRQRTEAEGGEQGSRAARGEAVPVVYPTFLARVSGTQSVPPLSWFHPSRRTHMLKQLRKGLGGFLPIPHPRASTKFPAEALSPAAEVLQCP